MLPSINQIFSANTNPMAPATQVGSQTQINTIFTQGKPPINVALEASQFFAPQITDPIGKRTDTSKLTTEQQTPKQGTELSYLDKILLNTGLFQNRLVKTAMENNPRIMEFCQQNGLSGKIEAKNLDDVANHARTTAKFALKIGEEMDLTSSELKTLELASKYHDIGKALIPREVFAKPGGFNNDERKIMDLHSELSAEILTGLGFEQEAVDIAGGHHSVYNLFDSKTPSKVAQICKVADIYSALTEPRSYKKALGNTEAFAIMDKMTQKGELYPEALSALKDSVLGNSGTQNAPKYKTNPFAATLQTS